MLHKRSSQRIASLAILILLTTTWVPPGAARAQSTSSQAQSTVTAGADISGNAYQVANPVTYFKTATGLQVVLTPAKLAGSGKLNGQNEGITLEIPDSVIKQLFF
jgi:hypothetical protein